MGRPQTIRLRESAAPLRDAKVIDADFVVVDRPTVWRRFSTAVTTLFWVAVIGFAAPQVWIFSQRIGDFFAER